MHDQSKEELLSFISGFHALSSFIITVVVNYIISIIVWRWKNDEQSCLSLLNIGLRYFIMFSIVCSLTFAILPCTLIPLPSFSNCGPAKDGLSMKLIIGKSKASSEVIEGGQKLKIPTATLRQLCSVSAGVGYVWHWFWNWILCLAASGRHLCWNKPPRCYPWRGEWPHIHSAQAVSNAVIVSRKANGGITACNDREATSAMYSGPLSWTMQRWVGDWMQAVSLTMSHVEN